VVDSSFLRPNTRSSLPICKETNNILDGNRILLIRSGIGVAEVMSTKKKNVSNIQKKRLDEETHVLDTFGISLAKLANILRSEKTLRLQIYVSDLKSSLCKDSREALLSTSHTDKSGKKLRMTQNVLPPPTPLEAAESGRRPAKTP
jgi:hypothetical protein